MLAMWCHLLMVHSKQSWNCCPNWCRFLLSDLHISCTVVFAANILLHGVCLPAIFWSFFRFPWFDHWSIKGLSRNMLLKQYCIIQPAVSLCQSTMQLYMYQKLVPFWHNFGTYILIVHHWLELCKWSTCLFLSKCTQFSIQHISLQKSGTVQ